MMKLRLPEKGFTLMEVMLAVAITAIALCGILATYMACFTMIKTSKNASIATSAAQGLMDEIRNAPFPLIKSTYNGAAFTPVSNLPQNNVAVDVDDSDPELLKVTVNISWREGNIIIPVELTTLIVDR